METVVNMRAQAATHFDPICLINKQAQGPRTCAQIATGPPRINQESNTGSPSPNEGAVGQSDSATWSCGAWRLPSFSAEPNTVVQPKCSAQGPPASCQAVAARGNFGLRWTPLASAHDKARMQELCDGMSCWVALRPMLPVNTRGLPIAMDDKERR